jgi:hypothetical protein
MIQADYSDGVRHCRQCGSTDPSDFNFSVCSSPSGYSKCCGSIVCDGFFRKIHLIIDGPLCGQEIEAWYLTTYKCNIVEACCVSVARHLLGV